MLCSCDLRFVMTIARGEGGYSIQRGVTTTGRVEGWSNYITVYCTWELCRGYIIYPGSYDRWRLSSPNAHTVRNVYSGDTGNYGYGNCAPDRSGCILYVYTQEPQQRLARWSLHT